MGGQGLTFLIGVAEYQQPAAVVILVRFAHVGILQASVRKLVDCWPQGLGTYHPAAGPIVGIAPVTNALW